MNRKSRLSLIVVVIFCTSCAGPRACSHTGQVAEAAETQNDLLLQQTELMIQQNKQLERIANALEKSQPTLYPPLQIRGSDTLYIKP